MTTNRWQVIKPIIPWIGGKGSILHEILPRFPKESFRYVEVFGGGGSVLFGKQSSRYEIYNDFQDDLVNLFVVVKHKHISFLTELNILPLQSRAEFQIILKFVNGDYSPLTRAEEEIKVAKVVLEPQDYKTVRKLLTTRAEMFDVNRAVNFYKKIRLSYAGSGKSFNSAPVTITSKKVHKDISVVHRRLRRVVIENKDFEDLIKHHDREDTFFYCDPPYFETEDTYDAPFTPDDHKRLFNVLSNIKGKFLLSYNDCDYIRDLYKDFDIVGIKRINNLKQRYDAGSIYYELLIANYDITNINPDVSIQLELGGGNL